MTKATVQDILTVQSTATSRASENRVRQDKYHWACASYNHRSDKLITQRERGTNLVDERHRLFARNAPDGADFLVVEQHSVELVRSDKHLWSERRRDELRSRREVVDHSWFLDVSIYQRIS